MYTDVYLVKTFCILDTCMFYFVLPRIHSVPTGTAYLGTLLPIYSPCPFLADWARLPVFGLGSSAATSHFLRFNCYVLHFTSRYKWNNKIVFGKHYSTVFSYWWVAVFSGRNGECNVPRQCCVFYVSFPTPNIRKNSHQLS